METFWLSFFKLLALIFVSGLASERGVQAIKSILNMIAAKNPTLPWLAFKDKKSFILAAVLILGVGYYFEVDLLHVLPVFSGFDAEWVKVLGNLLVLAGATWSHDKMFKGK